MIAKEGRDFTEVIKEITFIVDGPISGEVKAATTDAEGIIKEGREIAAIHPNMVVKIPMTIKGLKAVKVLCAEEIKTKMAHYTELLNPNVKPAPDSIEEKHFYRKHGENAYYG